MKYQKIKKEIVEAIQINKESVEELLYFVGADPLNKQDIEKFIRDMESKGIYIESPDGTKHALVGDYIVKTNEGYTIVICSLFESLYEKVTE